MALSEIEKLERRYAENPQGLTFAPLAEIHRKNGDVARALELLRPGLELHPNYIPASIVLGRCQLDLSDLPAAEAAFGHVLALDGENVIALKALADITERQRRFDQAEHWLRTLLSVDRSNDEARAQLERIENARRDSEAAPSVPGLEAEQPATSEPVEMVESEAVESAPAAEAEPVPPPAPVEPIAGWVSAPEAGGTSPLPLADLETDDLRDDGTEATPVGLEIEESQPVEEPVEPLAGIIGRDVDTPELIHDEFQVEQSEDIVLRSAGGHEFQVPDASLELSDRVPPTPPPSPFGVEAPPMFDALEETGTVREPTGEAARSVEPVAQAAPSEPVMLDEPAQLEEPIALTDEPPAAAEPSPEPVPALAEAELAPQRMRIDEPGHEAAELASPASLETPAPDVVAAAEPEPIVTETMAEVLLQQGHSVEALQVYRELDVQRAGDPRIRERIAAIEEEQRVSAREPGPLPEPAPGARRQYTAADTGGQSVAEFFRALLAARPPTVASAPAAARASAPPAQTDSAGAPTRPAADALSLSSVFGEETTAHPPAVPAAGAGQSSGVSFDEFYNPPGQSATAHKSRSPDPKNDDLDQFHAWLQNLKR